MVSERIGTARGLVQGDAQIFFCIFLALVYCRFRTVFMFHRHHHVFPIQNVPACCTAGFTLFSCFTDTTMSSPSKMFQPTARSVFYSVFCSASEATDSADDMHTADGPGEYTLEEWEQWYKEQDRQAQLYQQQ